MFEPQNGLINYYNQPNHWTMTTKQLSKNEDVWLYHNHTKYFFSSESPKPLKSGIENAVSREIDANNVYDVQPGNIIVSLK